MKVITTEMPLSATFETTAFGETQFYISLINSALHLIAWHDIKCLSSVGYD